MPRLVVTGSVLFFCSILPAQPRLPSRSTLGILSGEQFRVDERVRLSVGYSPSGTVCGAVIAPVGYRADKPPLTQSSMDSNLVDQVLEVILPGILTDKQRTGMMSIMSRNSFLNQEYHGAHLSRHYVSTNEGERTVVAMLQASPPCRGSNAATLQAHYGLPQMEEFTADGNITIGVRYGANQIPWRIDFTPTRPAGAASTTSALFNALGVEHWIATLTFGGGQSGTATHHVTSSGSRTTETDAYEDFSIERTYQDGALIEASLTWK